MIYKGEPAPERMSMEFYKVTMLLGCSYRSVIVASDEEDLEGAIKQAIEFYGCDENDVVSVYRNGVNEL